MQTDATGMEAIRRIIVVAKGGDARSDPEALSWETIADRVSMMPGAPESLDTDRVRRLITVKGTMPDDGTELRYILAALDVPLLIAYRAARHFPDLRWNGLSAVQRLVEVAEATGIPIEVCGSSRGQIAIRFVRRRP